MGKYVMALDQGTTSSRCILFDERGQIVSVAQKGLFVDRKSLRQRAKDLVERLQVKTLGIEHPVKQLSGGNIQKVLLGREIE